jgi:DNA-binding winged helix-turn-helix (wHTH) protein/Tol biopolymer transport system component
MAEVQRAVRPIRFATFEVDLDSGELRRNGLKLKLSGQPFQVLAMLLERPGTIVTREELQKRLWPDTFVDFDHNLNAAINRIREVLGDSAESPRFVETVPKRGYRFIAPVESPSPQTDQTVVANAVETSRKPQNRIHFRLAILTAVVLVAGLLAAVWIIFTRPPSTPKVVRFTRLTSDGQRKIGPLVSDGVRVYFNEWLPDGRLILAQASVKGGEVTPFSVPLKAPFVQDISRDGTELLLANDEGAQGRSIWVQPVAGGSPHRVGTVLTSEGPMGPGLDFAAFAEDANRILYSQGHDVYSVSRDGSALRKLLPVGHLTKGFRYSQDSQVLRFTQFDPYEVENIMSASADGTRLRKLVDGCCGEWTPDGRYFIFARQSIFRSDLWALRERRKYSWNTRDDKPIQLTAGPLDFQLPSPAKSGKEIFAIGTAHRAEFVRYDRKRGEFVPYLAGISGADLAFSADGQWMAYTAYPDGDLWRSRVDGSEKMQLTSSPLQTAVPRWSPDGKQIAFSAIVPGGAWNIYVIPSTGGSSERLLPSDHGQLDVDWSPDGKSLVFGPALDPKAGISIIDVNSRRVSMLPGSGGLFSPHWSPDGRYISGTTIESQNLMLFDTSTQSWTKPCDCGVAYPIWSHDGKYLYFQPDSEPGKGYRIVRLRMSDYKIETVADISSVVRWTALTVGQWFGLTQDDSPLIPRNIGSQEIYALEMEWP